MNAIQSFLARKILRIPEPSGEQALGGFSPFDGANNSQARTIIPLYPADPKKQVTPYTRKQLLSKYHVLRNNLGLVKRMVAGSAQYAIGTGCSPMATSSDEPWNKQHDSWFELVAMNPLLFDFEGRINYYRAQRSVAMSMMGEGEMFTNCVDPENLEGDYYLPQFQLLSPHRIDNAGVRERANETFDGLGLDPTSNRVKFYRVPRADGKGFDDLDAEHVIHTYDPERVGLIRGVTWLYHGINSVIDIMDLTALEKQAAKVHSALAAAVKSKAGNTGAAGLTGQLEALLTKTQMQQVQQADPKKRNQILEKIFGGGIVPFLAADEELTLLTSSRPSAVFTGFLDWLVRDIAWGFGVSPEFIWAVAGMGGANTRFILADAQWFFNFITTTVIENWAAPVRNKIVAAGMLAYQRTNGAVGIPECKDPNWMTKVHWQTPPKVTADPGKEAQSSIALLANGMGTWGDFWGGQGANGRIKVQERIREVGQAMLDVETVRKELDPTGAVLTPEAYNFKAIFPMTGSKPGGPPSNDPSMPQNKKPGKEKPDKPDPEADPNEQE